MSKGYERRTAYAARVGIAFHKTLQSLAEHPIWSDNQSEIVDEAYRRFRHELALQEEQKDTRTLTVLTFPRCKIWVKRS